MGNNYKNNYYETHTLLLLLLLLFSLYFPLSHFWMFPLNCHLPPGHCVPLQSWNWRDGLGSVPEKHISASCSSEAFPSLSLCRKQMKIQPSPACVPFLHPLSTNHFKLKVFPKKNKTMRGYNITCYYIYGLSVSQQALAVLGSLCGC